MLQNFDLARTLVCDPYLSEVRRQELECSFVSLETLLREADVVTVHTPLGPETYHLLDEAQFRLMKPTAVLVNTARGGIVNLDAHSRLRHTVESPVDRRRPSSADRLLDRAAGTAAVLDHRIGAGQR